MQSIAVAPLSHVKSLVVWELEYVKDQRDRVNHPGLFQISPLDRSTTESMNRKIYREQMKGSRAHPEPTVQVPVIDEEILGESSDSDSDKSIEEYFKPVAKPIKPMKDWRRTKLTLTANEAEHFGISNRGAAAVATAFLMDTGVKMQKTII